MKQEEKFEEKQKSQTTGRKILWIVAPEYELQIGKNLQQVMESLGIHHKRIIYNNLRSNDEFPGWENLCNKTDAELLAQAHQLAAGECYILDYLQLVQFSTDMATCLSIGKALFHAATSRGADCLVITLSRPAKTAEALKTTRILDWQQQLMDLADVVLQDDATERIK